MLKVLLRSVIGVVAVICLTLAGGYVWHSYSDAENLRRYPAPGQRVDVGGGRFLHILCKGSGAGPTVILEAGLGDISANLWPLQDEVATFARVCTYDRGGYGWSDGAPPGRTMDDVARDLHTLLVNAGISPPYVLAAHSLGGFYARLFVRDFPGGVAGLVLIDSSEEGFNLGPVGMTAEPTIAKIMTIADWAARFGLAPILSWAIGGAPEKPLPTDAEAMDLRPAKFRAASDEIRATEDLPDAMRVPGGFGTLGPLPLMVISRDPDQPAATAYREADWTAGQLRLVALSSESERIIAKSSRHQVYLDQPALVADAIRKVYEAARDGRSLSAM